MYAFHTSDLTSLLLYLTTHEFLHFHSCPDESVINTISLLEIDKNNKKGSCQLKIVQDVNIIFPEKNNVNKIIRRSPNINVL